jgi:hypothetical protein
VELHVPHEPYWYRHVQGTPADSLELEIFMMSVNSRVSVVYKVVGNTEITADIYTPDSIGVKDGSKVPVRK